MNDVQPDDQLRRAIQASNHGIDLANSYLRKGSLDDLDRAIGQFTLAVQLTPSSGPYRTRFLVQLGASLATRFEHTASMDDLNHGIEALGEAVEGTPIDDPDRFDRAFKLGVVLLKRFDRTENTADFNRAIELLDDAVVADIARDLLTDFERSGRTEDLDRAITAFEKGLTAADRTDDPVAWRCDFATALWNRFERTGSAADLDGVIRLLEQALTVRNHRDWSGHMSNLGIALQIRFNRTGSIKDINRAIEVHNEALEATTPGDWHRPGIILNLGAAFGARFERTGDTADLDQAIEQLEQAVNSPGNHRAGSLSTLGVLLRIRSGRTGSRRDLEKAINLLRDAVTATPHRDIRRAGRLSNLGATLQIRYGRTGTASDLDDAITALQQAADATPAGHLDRAGTLSNLGGALLTRFRLTPVASDLDDAITALSQALEAEAAPTGPLGRAGALSNLGAALMERLKRTETTRDLNLALDVLGQAVKALPADHPTRAHCLFNLGNALYISYKLTGKEADLDSAINSQRAAYEMKTAAPTVRGRAAQAWGQWAFDDAGDYSAAVEGYSAAVGMLPLIAWHGLDQTTREEALSNWAGLAADAAACAIADGQHERAVELLEQGRSVLWTQTLHIRTDLSLLREASPELAAQLEQARQELDSEMPASAITADTAVAGMDPSGQSQEWARERRRRAATLWDKTLEKVWDMKGFEYFLRPQPFTELSKAAVGGPVVIVNVSLHGCHALIISDKETLVDSTRDSASSTAVQVENLPALTVDAVIRQMGSLLDVQSRLREGRRPHLEQARDQNIVFDLLRWLWNTVAQPTLQALGHARQLSTGQTRPRLWWCPTRELTMLPIHAAGNYDGGSHQTVYSRVISSYTPTLSELIRARRAHTPTLVQQLAIGMTTTPGQDPLPSVEDELAILSSYLPEPERAHHLRDENATRAAAMHALGEYPWIHMACHTSQNHSDPSRSAFQLHDGPLTISELAAVSTENAELAYLSACHTVTGSTRLLDEAIHLAAAMQLAGYRHVIATMWSIKDPPSPDVADEIYGALTHTGRIDPAGCAAALHAAVEMLRNRFPREPLTWAPYVHIGP